MKNANQKTAKKSLKESNKKVVGFHKGEIESNKRFIVSNQGEMGVNLSEIGTNLPQMGVNLSRMGANLPQMGVNLSHIGTNLPQMGVNLPQIENNKAGKTIFLPIILLKLLQDYIPHTDGDFDEWQKNYVKQLSAPFPPFPFPLPSAASGGSGPDASAAAIPSSPLYAYLGIPAERYNELLQTQQLWNVDFARGGQKTDRRMSEVKAKQKTRRDYVKLTRSISKEYILYNRRSSDEIKRMLKLTVPDTEPSPVHGTDAPVVGLKNAGGSVIDVRCKRSEDQTRSSMLKGYVVEMRYLIGPPQPTDPDMTGMKFEISSKAHFKITAGMLNLGKTFYCYLRWRSKTTAAFNSPWTNLLQIVIA